VALATSGPGATNMVTGIATAMMDSSLHRLHHRPGGQLGARAATLFRRRTFTGITLPITKHNYLVTRRDEIAVSLREAFHIAASDRPGPVLVDITKDAQLGTANSNWKPAAPKAHPPSSDFLSDSVRLAEAAALINESQRPVILAGHGIILSGGAGGPPAGGIGAYSVALTLLGLGAFPPRIR